MRYDKQTWDTTSYVNPTRMNHIEQGIYDADLTSGGSITGDLTIDSKNGTTAERGYGLLVIGNNKPEGTEGNTRGLIDLYGTTAYRARLVSGALTGNRQIEFPDKAGTIALREDITPTAYSTDGTTYSGCSLVDGGYVRVGNIIILNIRVEISTASSSTRAYITLPSDLKPKTVVALTAFNSSDDLTPIYAIANTNGSIYLKGTTANKAFSISGVWIC